MSFRVNHRSPLSMAVMFGLGFAVTGGGIAIAQVAGNGPASDFPVVLGAPYSIGSTTYTPSDTMNYDAVGHATVGEGTAISAAHHILPVPSYVEVTSLDSGRTILVRVDRRGPMGSTAIIELSAAAAAQLGVGNGAAVRVRRVSPPEAERAMLRAGGPAPERMATPRPLLVVLNRRLNPDATVGLNAASQEAPVPAHPSPRPLPMRHAAAPDVAGVATVTAPPAVVPKAPAMPKAQAVPAAPPPKPRQPQRETPPAAAAAPAGDLVVQAGAFADKAHAAALAGRIGGRVSAAGHLWRVRKGPYATRAEAEAALAKVRADGAGNAQIQHAD